MALPPLSDLLDGLKVDAGEKLLAGQWHGRTVVDVAD